MASDTTEILHDFFPLLRVYKDGRVERYIGNDVVPASVHPTTGVQSKDVEIAPQTGVSARLYIPKTTNQTHKLPLLVYFHGGGFIAGSPSSLAYHNYLNLLVAQANIVAVSVEYRLAPEHYLPAAYDDSWTAIQWIASHSTRGGHEAWLKDYVDFERVFFAGDSAGGNIAHNMAIRVGSEKVDGVKLVGIVLIHPYFWGEEPMGVEEEVVHMHMKNFIDNLWFFVNPSTGGLDDPLVNPALNPKLSSVGCSRVLVCVAEKDVVRDRGWYYQEVLGKSGWNGKVEVMETKGEEHVFHLFKPTCDNAVAMLKKVASFMNQD